MNTNYLPSFFYHLAIFGIILLLFGCAQETAPTGGQKDTQPPIAVKSKPNNKQTNFLDNSISITFNEFVVLKDAVNQILISPPIFPKPTFSIKGKSVVVNLKNSELEPNTTYNIFFGDAIQDLHEGNIIPNFHYVFSTGETIDSLSFSGVVVHAFEDTQQEGVFVMLYLNDNDTIPFDSLPYRVLPRYICRTQKNGFFNFSNLHHGEYKIFALKDENRNFLYDLPEEMIAFSDSTIIPYYENSITNDSTQTEDSTSTNLSKDSLAVLDTLSHNHDLPNFKLFMFKEVDSTVKLKEVKVIDSLSAQFFFSFETKNPKFRLLKPDSLENDSLWMFEEWNDTKDTLLAWFPNLISDSLLIEINNDYQVIDTVLVALKQPKKPHKKTKKEEEKDTLQTILPPPPLKISVNASGTFSFFNPLKITFPTPLQQWNFDHVIFSVNDDTISTPSIVYNPKKREAVFAYSFKEQTNYSLEIPEGACTNIIGLINDTTKFTFTTDESSKYGTLKIHLSLPENSPQVILQLLTEDAKSIIKEFVIQESGSVNFGYLSPRKIKIKAIFDTNGNGKWDAGNYLYRIQPERTFIYEKIIEIRAYWDAEENWKIEDF